MVDTLLTFAVSSVLERYLQGFDAKRDMKVSFVKGETEIKNCILNTKAVMALMPNAPFEIAKGYVIQTEH